MTLNDIENAYMFVSSGDPGGNAAYLCKKSGQIFYASLLIDIDELPDDIDDEQYIEIPTKRDLRLGKDLVLDFVAGHLPEEMHSVEAIFQRRGAYARFKQLLVDCGLLQQWYDYESEATTAALREWCEFNGIELSEEKPRARGDDVDPL